MSNYKPKKRDRQGSIVGSIAGKVNAAMSGKWQTADRIIAKAGVGRAQGFLRLHNGKRKGIYEYERLIRFRLKRRKKK